MSDAPANIVEFNRLALRTLTMLYESFPTRRDIEPFAEMLGEIVTAEDDDNRQRVGNAPSLLQATVDWLIEEGYVSVLGSTLDGSFVSARLTGKGLAILGMPSSLAGSRQTVYERIKDAAATGVGSAAGKKLGDAMSDVLGGAMRISLSSWLG